MWVEKEEEPQEEDFAFVFQLQVDDQMGVAEVDQPHERVKR